jgi:hypothetical protein
VTLFGGAEKLVVRLPAFVDADLDLRSALGQLRENAVQG